MTEKVEWTDITWNPVWGCRNNCLYCYARKMTKRFSRRMAVKEGNFRYIGHEIHKNMYPDNYNQFLDVFKIGFEDFVPRFLKSNFHKTFPKKPKRIFVNSMSDIAFWDSDWMNRILEKIKEYPQHTFHFLTKLPGIYNDYNFPKNCWLGTSVSTEEEAIMRGHSLAGKRNTFFSIEPIQEKIQKAVIPIGLNWLIIGAETGSCKNEIIPQLEWIEELIDIDLPVYLKDNLKPYYLGEFRQEFPA